MSNRFYELERRCTEYRRKKNLKSLALGAVVGVFLVTVAFYAGVFDKSQEFINNEVEEISQVEEDSYEDVDSDDGYITQTTDEIMNEELGQKEEEDLEVEHVVFEDIKDVDEKFVVAVKDNVSIEPKEEVLDKPIVKEVEVVEKKPLFLEPQISLDLLKKKIDKKPIKVIEKVVDVTSDMQKEFNVSHKIETALSISQVYYDKKDFKSSLKWAIEASKIDSKAPKPWVMYARAKAKSGDVAIAIKALQTYLSEFYSEEASVLLDELKSTKRLK